MVKVLHVPAMKGAIDRNLSALKRLLLSQHLSKGVLLVETEWWCWASLLQSPGGQLDNMYLSKISRENINRCRVTNKAEYQITTTS